MLKQVLSFYDKVFSFNFFLSVLSFVLHLPIRIQYLMPQSYDACASVQ